MVNGTPLASPGPLLCCSTVPVKLPIPAQYQRMQLVLQLLVSPLGSCVAVLQPTEGYKAESLGQDPVLPALQTLLHMGIWDSPWVSK